MKPQITFHENFILILIITKPRLLCVLDCNIFSSISSISITEGHHLELHFMKTSFFQRVRLEDGRQTRKLAYNYKKEDGRGRFD